MPDPEPTKPSRSTGTHTDDLRVRGAGDRRALDRGPAFTFTFGGSEVLAHRGETIGAALLATGVRALRTTRVGGRPRGLFCGIGACFDCLVTVEDVGVVRACLTPAAPGQRVVPHALERTLAPGDGMTT